MPEESQDKHFDTLLSRFLDQDLEGDELKEFIQLVKANDRYSDLLRDQLALDQKLKVLEAGDVFAENVHLAIQAREEEDDFTDQVMQLTQKSEHVTVVYPWLISVASLAACLLMGLLFVFRNSEDLESTDEGVAVISSLTGRLDRSLVKGDSVGSGTLELQEGYLSLEFYGGARVDLVAPAKLELIDGMKVRCLYGKLKAHVPEVAKGFQVLTQDAKVVDLGTEFALNVSEGTPTEIHVFDGEVEAYDAKGTKESMRLLKAGEAYAAFSHKLFSAQPETFQDLMLIDKMEKEFHHERQQGWEKIRAQYSKDKRVIAYYDFETQNEVKRRLLNVLDHQKEFRGAIVGAQWSEGPWTGKQALEFKRPSDRVRINIPGEFSSLTLTCWVRFDGLDRQNSSLMLTDGYDLNEVHWQIRKGGSIGLGLHHRDDVRTTYSSPSVVNLKTLGQWMHLATVVDNQKGLIEHYKNGELIQSSKLKLKTPLRIGLASIGNWNHPVNTPNQIRNLNGAIAEMMLFNAVLSEQEIKKLSLSDHTKEPLQL
jgi:hypothetical protein